MLLKASSAKHRFFNGDTSLNEGLVTYWGMNDDNPNTHVADSLGGVQGVLLGGSNTEDLSVVGANGKALDFDGTNYINVSPIWDLLSLSSTTPFSIFFLAKRTGGTTSSYILFSSKENPVDKGISFFQISTSGKAYILLRTDGSNWIRCQSTSAIPLNTWALIGFTYTGSGLSSGLTVYINTTASTDRSSAGSFSSLTTTKALICHEDYAGGGVKFDGEMQALGIWKKELSSNEVTKLYNNGDFLLC